MFQYQSKNASHEGQEDKNGSWSELVWAMFQDASGKVPM
jgi:hypothetical protein